MFWLAPPRPPARAQTHAIRVCVPYLWESDWSHAELIWRNRDAAAQLHVYKHTSICTRCYADDVARLVPICKDGENIPSGVAGSHLGLCVMIMLCDVVSVLDPVRRLSGHLAH